MMWLKYICLVTLFISLQYLTYAQCNNVDFELGNFTGWQGRTGICCPINLPTNGIITGRHTIMTGPGTDANTCNVVPLISPTGGNFSAGLGNNINGRQAEGLNYTFPVTINSALFIYQYAVVFQDPGHNPADQPRFQTQIIDAAGNVIPCTQYYVTSASNIPGFQTCNSGVVPVRFRNWSTVGVDLTAYIGQTVTAQFATGDCNLGAHYGYAYIDGLICQPMALEVLYCIGQDSAMLTAPIGFASYLWSNGSTTDVTIVDPMQYTVVTCTLTTFSGCVIVLTSTLIQADPVPDFIFTDTCLGGNTTFTNQSTSSNSPIISYTWNFGDGTIDTTTNPNHVYQNSGVYLVTLTAVSQQGCIDTISHLVTISPILIQVNNSDICIGESATLTASGATTYTWSPTTGLNTTTGSVVIATPTQTTNYTIIGIDSNGCIGTTTSTVIVDSIPPIDPIIHN